jgi:hypothetical protein
MTPIPAAESPSLPMARARTADTLIPDSSMDERHGWSDVMHPILVEQMAQHRIDTFRQEAVGIHRAALGSESSDRRPSFRGRILVRWATWRLLVASPGRHPESR